jgi:hypothetical protein
MKDDQMSDPSVLLLGSWQYQLLTPDRQLY